MQQVIIKEKKKLMENILLCINMMVLSVQDIMYKSLNVIILVILTITAVIYTAFNFNFSLPEIIAGICFVGALFGVSITFKCIGIGDVIVTLIVILIKGTVFTEFSITNEALTYIMQSPLHKFQDTAQMEFRFLLRFPF